uniref:Agmatinase n=1 Tax=Agrobacterium vitis TaxID=373 RepID=A7XEC4_AGRVI|nr:agmatinase [Agrobacterium vitis]
MDRQRKSRSGLPKASWLPPMTILSTSRKSWCAIPNDLHGSASSPAPPSRPIRKRYLRKCCFDTGRGLYRIAASNTGCGSDTLADKSIDHAFTANDLTSAATDPTYAGVLSFMRRRYTKVLDGVDTAVWGIPFDAATSNRPGARFGPQAIRRASAIFDNDPQYPFERDLFAAMPTVDYGDCRLDYGNHWETPATIEKEAADILSKANFLLTLAGEPFHHLAAAEGPCRQTWPSGAGAIRCPSGYLVR